LVHAAGAGDVRGTLLSRGDLDRAAEDGVEAGVFAGHGEVLRTSAQSTVRVSGRRGITPAGIISSGPRCLVAQGGIEPGAGGGPIPLGGDRGDAQARGGLLDREAGEVTELDQLRLERLLAGEPGERLVEGEQVVESVLDGQGDGVERDPLLTAAVL